MINLDELYRLCRENGIDIDAEKAEKLDAFAEFLLSENEKYNLTAIKTPEAIILRHFCDSLTATEHICQGSKLLDIGSGAGFPAVPIALFRPDVTVTGLDATAKKAAFINLAAEKLALSNLSAVSGRAEELARNASHEGMYDVVTARAVSALRILCELASRYLKVGGRLIALKGDPETTAAELEEAKLTAKAVSLSLEAVIPLSISDSSTGETLSRTIVIMKKTAPTAKPYPRRYAQILKTPIK